MIRDIMNESMLNMKYIRIEKREDWLKNSKGKNINFIIGMMKMLSLCDEKTTDFTSIYLYINYSKKEIKTVIIAIKLVGFYYFNQKVSNRFLNAFFKDNALDYVNDINNSKIYNYPIFDTSIIKEAVKYLETSNHKKWLDYCDKQVLTGTLSSKKALMKAIEWMSIVDKSEDKVKNIYVDNNLMNDKETKLTLELVEKYYKDKDIIKKIKFNKDKKKRNLNKKIDNI